MCVLVTVNLLTVLINFSPDSWPPTPPPHRNQHLQDLQNRNFYKKNRERSFQVSAPKLGYGITCQNLWNLKLFAYLRKLEAWRHICTWKHLLELFWTIILGRGNCDVTFHLSVYIFAAFIGSSTFYVIFGYCVVKCHEHHLWQIPGLYELLLLLFFSYHIILVFSLLLFFSWSALPKFSFLPLSYAVQSSWLGVHGKVHECEWLFRNLWLD